MVTLYTKHFKKLLQHNAFFFQKGDPVMVQPSLSNEEAMALFSKNIKTVNLPSGKGYVRLIQEPTDS